MELIYYIPRFLPFGCYLPTLNNNHSISPIDDRPFSVSEILNECFGVNPALALTNLITGQQSWHKDAGISEHATDVKVVGSKQLRVQSVLYQPIEETIVDFIIECRIHVTVPKGIERYSVAFRVRYILNLVPCQQTCIGPIVFLAKDWRSEPPLGKLFYEVQNLNSDNVIATNEYLVPVLYQKDYPRVAEDMKETYLPKNQQNQGVDPKTLAKHMGLKIQLMALKDSTVMGELFLLSGKVCTADEYGRNKTVRVKGGTILINTAVCTTEYLVNSTIVHECSHMHLHRLYFLLQMMKGDKTELFARRKRTDTMNEKTPLDWMEFQCEKLPAYLLMEQDDTKQYAQSILNYHQFPSSVHAMSDAIRKVSEKYHISKAMAKYRLIDLGFYSAEGIANYIDGRYIPDHTCRNWKKGITYTLSADNALCVLMENKKLADSVQCGKYIYIEGHFCLNRRGYIRYRKNGDMYLTDYARNHINECCIGFQVSGNRAIGSYRNGSVAREKVKQVTDRYLSEYQITETPDEKVCAKEDSIFTDDSWLWGELFISLPADFKGALMMILEKKGVTQLALANDMGVDKKMIYNMLNGISLSVEHVVAVCVTLKLPYYISEKLLTLAGFSLTASDAHQLYRGFLSVGGRMPLERCNGILVKNKMKPLTNGQDQ